MPRKTRSQPGTSGGNYANRSDMTQPVQVPTGQAYGERQASEASQAAAPLPQAADPWDTVMQHAQAMPFQPVPLNAPSERPHEPVTHGLPTGPGAGPEALGPQTGVSAALQRAIAISGGNGVLQALLENAQRAGI